MVGSDIARNDVDVILTKTVTYLRQIERKLNPKYIGP